MKNSELLGKSPLETSICFQWLMAFEARLRALGQMPPPALMKEATCINGHLCITPRYGLFHLLPASFCVRLWVVEFQIDRNCFVVSRTDAFGGTQVEVSPPPSRVPAQMFESQVAAGAKAAAVAPGSAAARDQKHLVMAIGPTSRNSVYLKIVTLLGKHIRMMTRLVVQW